MKEAVRMAEDAGFPCSTGREGRRPMPRNLEGIIYNYVEQVKKLLGERFKKAVLYGSCARDEYTEDSDIDLAIFTNAPASEFYMLADKIAEDTFEFNVKYDVILSPVFVNEEEYWRKMKVLPYYQSIQREGVAIG